LARLGALEDATGIDTKLMKHVSNIGSVAHQAADCDNFSNPVERWNPVARGQCGKLYPSRSEECIGSDKERIGMLPRNGRKGRIYLASSRGVEYLDLQPDAGGGLLDSS